MGTIPYQDDVTEFCDFFRKNSFQDMATTKNLPKTYHTKCEPTGSHPISSLLIIMVAERRGSHQKFQNLIAEAPITSNLTSEFITFASLYGTNTAPTQEVGTKWFRGNTELVRGHRAARAVPKVSEFYSAGAKSLKLHIRIHQKQTYIGTNRFFMFHTPPEKGFPF